MTSIQKILTKLGLINPVNKISASVFRLEILLLWIMLIIMLIIIFIFDIEFLFKRNTSPWPLILSFWILLIILIPVILLLKWVVERIRIFLIRNQSQNIITRHNLNLNKLNKNKSNQIKLPKLRKIYFKGSETPYVKINGHYLKHKNYILGKEFNMLYLNSILNKTISADVLNYLCSSKIIKYMKFTLNNKSKTYQILDEIQRSFRNKFKT
jgi:hypothetical protein